MGCSTIAMRDNDFSISDTNSTAEYGSGGKGSWSDPNISYKKAADKIDIVTAPTFENGSKKQQEWAADIINKQITFEINKGLRDTWYDGHFGGEIKYKRKTPQNKEEFDRWNSVNNIFKNGIMKHPDMKDAAKIINSNETGVPKCLHGNLIYKVVEKGRKAKLSFAEIEKKINEGISKPNFKLLKE